MRTSLLRRAAAVTVIAASTLLMAAGTADAASKGSPNHPTSLSILAPKAGPKHASKGAAKPANAAAAKPASTGAAKAGKKKGAARHRNRAIVRGVLKSGKAGLAREVVFLDRLAPGGKPTVAGKALTNKAGVVVFAVSRKGTARYVLVFNGTSALSASHSGAVTVKAS